MIEELDASGSVLARYTQRTGVDEPLAMTQGLTTPYFHADGLGSITSLTNSAGNLAASYVYDSFGNLTASTGTITNPFQYTGREFDSETGLYYYRARYYDASVGRFLSEDPIEFEGGGDFYGYVGNEPVGDSDPTGLAKKKRRQRPKFPKCDAIFPQDPTTAMLAQLVYAEGNNTPIGDLAVASVVVNRATSGESIFPNTIPGVIEQPRQFQGYNNLDYRSVSSQEKVCRLNPENCKRFKNAALAASAALTTGTNTDALFYYDESIPMPRYLVNGLKNGTIVPAPVNGESNQVPGGPGGYTQDFYVDQ